MRPPLTEEDLGKRAAIDGRAAFGAAAFGLAAGLVILLDRIGVPDGIVAVLGPSVALVGLALLGLLLRNMRVSSFYLGGRHVPVPYAGLAFAAIALALLVPFARSIPSGLSLAGVLAGFAGGGFLAAFGTGPLLRKTGALSVPDMIIGRFPNIALRLGIVVIVACAAALVGLAALSLAAQQIGLVLGLSPAMSLIAAAIIVGFLVEPGGLSGVVWGAAAAMGILLVGLLLPLALTAFADGSLPFPVGGDRNSWREGLTFLERWRVAPSALRGFDPVLLATLMLGFGTLAPVLMPAMATATRAGAQRAGLAGLFWCALVVAAAAVGLTVATLALVHGIDGLRPERLPNFLLEASAHGDVMICSAHPGTPAAARSACATSLGTTQVLKPEFVSASASYLLRGISDLRGFGTAFSGLAAAGGIAIALVLAAACVHALGTALGHDLFYRVRAAGALTSRRLAVTRFVMLIAIIVGVAFLMRQKVNETALIGFAVALSAAVVAPLLGLVLWPRANSTHASIALVTGLASAEGMLYWQGTGPSVASFALAALVACGASFGMGVIASLLQRADPTSHGVAFVHAVLHGESDVLHPDKAA